MSLNTRQLQASILLALLLALLASIGCEDEGTGSNRPSPTLNINATAAPATPTPLPPFPPGATFATVVNVVDGDTIVVEIDGQEYRVRYIGINTPETVDPRRPVECFGEAASERNKELVEGQSVGLEKDVSETDRFGRLLRYVWLNQSDMVNAMLVRDGYASATAYPPDVRHQDLLDGLEQRARTEGLGLWGDECAETPSPAAAQMSGGACEYTDGDDPVIKGNISQNTGEKIYHVPGGEFYEPTRIDESAGERWFCTESEALEAGWRKTMQ